jgi:hypothetical protein
MIIAALCKCYCRLFGCDIILTPLPIPNPFDEIARCFVSMELHLVPA